MSFKVTNTTTGDLVLADGTIISRGDYIEVDELSDAITEQYADSKVTISPAPPIIGTKLTDSSGGTASTTDTIAAVTDFATAADAIATLAAAIEKNRLMLA